MKHYYAVKYRNNNLLDIRGYFLGKIIFTEVTISDLADDHLKQKNVPTLKQRP